MNLWKHLAFKILIWLFILGLSSETSAQEKAPEMPDGYCSNFTLKVAYFFGTLDLIDDMPPVPDDIIEYKDITYETEGDRSLKLDIYHLKEINSQKPLLLFIHGGSWKKGKKEDYRRYLVDFALKGFVTATVQYSLAKVAKFPKPVNEIKSAIRWLKSNADQYFIDPNNIVLIGGSAGGHLAMMAGYTGEFSSIEPNYVDSTNNSRVRAVVNIYGPSNLTTDYGRNHPSVENFLGKKYNEDKNIFKAASPIFYLTPDDPPTLIFHGTLDELVPVSQSDSLILRLEEVGIEADYHKLEGWPHTMDLSVEVNAYCQYYMDKFINEHILKE